MVGVEAVGLYGVTNTIVPKWTRPIKHAVGRLYYFTCVDINCEHAKTLCAHVALQPGITRFRARAHKR